MKQIINYFVSLLITNTSILFTYRMDLYAGAISSFLWLMLSLVSISVLTYQSVEIGGWNKYELFVVQGVYSIILGTIYLVFGENIKNLGQLVRSGNLDLLLTKPIDSQLLVSISQFKFYQLVRIVLGLALLLFALTVLQINITFTHVALFLFFCCAGIIIIYSIWFVLTTLNFWLIDLFNIYELMVNFTGITRYPLEIIRFVKAYLIYVLLPLVVVTTVPAQILINRLNPQLAFWATVLSIILFSVSRKFWQFALKHYTSAGG